MTEDYAYDLSKLAQRAGVLKFAPIEYVAPSILYPRHLNLDDRVLPRNVILCRG